MTVDFSTLSVRDAYQWLTASIYPRPIAWVSTISPEGRTNLAPFSFFQGVTSNPPTLLFIPVNNRDGGMKDTIRNIQAVREFVVNLVPHALAETMNATSASLPHGESEFEAFGIAPLPSQKVWPPRVAASPLSFECTLDRIVPVGEGPLAAHVIFGRIHLVHVDDTVLDADGRPDPARLDLIGRLGGEFYTRTTDRFALKRPDR